MPLLFEWDKRKASSNIRKHGVTFEEASTVLGDTLSITVPDPGHSEDEDRWFTLGVSNSARILVVIHVEDGNRIRIISARPATAGERIRYEEN